jgi:hypothetical protein
MTSWNALGQLEVAPIRKLSLLALVPLRDGAKIANHPTVDLTALAFLGRNDHAIVQEKITIREGGHGVSLRMMANVAP